MYSVQRDGLQTGEGMLQAPQRGEAKLSQLWTLGAGPWKGGAKGLRLQWELRSGTHRALPSQSALAGAPPPPADYKLLCDFLPLPW